MLSVRAPGLPVAEVPVLIPVRAILAQRTGKP